MKSLTIAEFGDSILRKHARQLKPGEIESAAIQTLIKNMRHTLLSKKLGVALAAPQVGQSIALFVIAVRPTEHRPHVQEFDAVMINPQITQRIGPAKDMWEGCISSGSGQSGLFAKVARHDKVRVTYLDQKAQPQTKQFDGLVAQIIQHETDHLQGTLFVDHVTDPKTYMTLQEYKKHITAP